MAKKSEQEHSLVISAVDKTKATFKSVKSSLSDIQGTVNGVKGHLAGLGVALSTASFASMVKGAIEATASLKGFQMQTGLSAQAISAINYATGGNVEPVAKAMGHLAKSAYAARDGSVEAKAAFAALGITYQQGNGQLKTSEQLFSDAAKAISRLPSEMDRAALAEKIFGKSYEEILPLLLKAKDGFGALAADARKYGVVLSQDVIDSSSKFVKETQKISRVLDSGSKVWAAKLAPGLSMIASAIQETIQAESDLQSKGKVLEGDGALSRWAETAITMIGGLIDIFDVLKRAVTFVGKFIGTALGGYVEYITNLSNGLSHVGSALAAAATGDFATARKEFAKGSEDIKNIGTGLANSLKEQGNNIAEVFASPRLSAGFRKAGEKALAEHQALIDKADRQKKGQLTAEEKFTDRILSLQQQLAKGMQASMAKQIEAIDKLEKRLKEARDRQSNVKDDFQKARDELTYGSVNGDGTNRREEIKQALAAAQKAKAAGKFDIADAESRKVIGILQAEKAAGPVDKKALQDKVTEIGKQQLELAAEYKKISDTLDSSFGNTADTRFGDTSEVDAKNAQLSSLSDRMRSLAIQRNGLISASTDNRLGSSETDGYLNEAQNIAQSSADANVKSLEAQTKVANAKLDELYAKVLRLKNVEISFAEDKTIKNVNDLMAKLQKSINDNPLVLTAVNAPSLSEADKKANDLLPDIFKARVESQETLPAPRLPEVSNYTGGYTKTTVDAQPKQPLNLTIPQMGQYMLQGDPDTLDALRKSILREQLKAGQTE